MVESSIQRGIADAVFFFVVPYIRVPFVAFAIGQRDAITRAHGLAIRLT